MWGRRMEWPLYAAALLFFGAYAWPILQPALHPTARFWCDVVTWATWALFALDYVIRLSVADSRWKFVRTHLFDLTVVVLPLVRPLRLLRLLTTINALNRTASMSLRGHVVSYVVGATSLVVLCASLAVLDAERSAPDSTITSFADALWWAIATVTTVGYGDSYPATAQGRLIAVGLMLAGIALLGVVTATLASWLVQRVSEAEEQTQAATRQQIDQLENKIDALRAELSTTTLPAVERPLRAGGIH